MIKFEKFLINVKKYSLFIFLIFSFILFCARNLDPLIFPTLYAEDGAWTGSQLTQGFFKTAFEERVFPILGFIILHKIGIIIASLIFEDYIFYLPIFYFLISNLFMASIATITLHVLKKILSNTSIIAIILSILFLPVGIDGNEIYGRILNLGFFFPYLHTILVINFLVSNRSKLSIFYAISFSLLSCLTQPVSIAISFVSSLALLIRYVFYKKNKIDLIIAFAFMATSLISLFFLSVESFTSQGGAALPIKTDAIIEFAIARSALYLFVFGFYSHLNNTLVLFFSLLLIALITHSFLKSLKIMNSNPKNNDEYCYILFFIWGSAFSYLFAIVFMRLGLTSLFNDYQSSWPDRYFTGLNLLFFTAVIFSIDRLNHGKYIIVLLSIPLLLTSINRMELDKPKFKINNTDSWLVEICKINKNKNDLYYKIPIQPLGWYSNIPHNIFNEALTNRCKKSNSYDISVLKNFQNDIIISLNKFDSKETLKISNIKQNNGVNLKLINTELLEITTTKTDPSIILSFSNKDPNIHHRKINLSFTTNTKERIQIFYLKNNESEFSEINSIFITPNNDNISLLFAADINIEKIRIDFPDAIGNIHYLKYEAE